MTPRGARTLRASRLALVVTVATIAAAAACKKSSPPPPEVTESLEAPAAWVPDASVGPRCEIVPGGLAIGEPAERRFLTLGDAVATEDGIALGLVRSGAASVAGSMQASIARVRVDLASAQIVDLGMIGADALPPRPFLHAGALYALYSAGGPAGSPGAAVKLLRDAGARRVTPLVLARVGDGASEALASVLETTDESFGADALIRDTDALIAWDEDAPGRDRGVIKLARVRFAADAGRAGTGTVVSPDGSDAESPRLAPRPGGAWLAWIARRPEPLVPSDAALDDTRIEAPAERRAYQWIELLALDAEGAPVGAVRKLTSTSAHVGAFDLAPRGSGGDLDVVVRDEDEAAEGAGGKLTRVTVHAEAAGGAGGVDAPVTLVAGGAGRGAVDLVSGDGSEWLAFGDTSDRTRVVRLGDTRLAIGAPSVEPSLDGARLLLAVRSGAAGAADAAGTTTLIAAVPGDEKPLRRVVCRR